MIDLVVLRGKGSNGGVSDISSMTIANCIKCTCIIVSWPVKIFYLCFPPKDERVGLFRHCPLI